ncbi:DUF6798 domain-containing protein [Neorhodopirellula pilleata]|uniref:DUF6798 domain-containing protein n=1 Tax=Neorhodopirellula pilleata TaxID=2714738 RepID=A0A5C6AIN7_9BACT|nr:DUF6798 domain-containing protein [Neorhodopirellula pilleata]TWT99035.1 hypothetical protein Pla100_22090 [Neorhodopirellula pilleata]
MKERSDGLIVLTIVSAIVALFFIVAGDAPPGVNEAHYLTKAKNFWDPEWCRKDLFVTSGKAHWFFYWTFGWPTLFVSLSTTAWIGRAVGWALIAYGLTRLTRSLRLPVGYSLIIAIVWLAGIQNGNLAGEWVVGGIEAKVPAYGLVLLGLSELVARRWNRVWIYFGTAAAFHVLTGGWSVVAGWVAFVWLERIQRNPNEPKARFLTPALFVGGVISLLGLIPALGMSSGATAAESVSAAKTYAYFRISHHLLPSAFHFDWYVRHGILTLVTIVFLATYLHRRKKASQELTAVAAFAAGALFISIAGLFVGMLPAVSPDWGARLLRFYWFRLADAITPLALACAVAVWMRAGIEGRSRNVARSQWISPAMITSVSAVLISVYLLGQSTWHNVTGGVPISVSNRLLGLHSDADYATQRRTMADWIKVCRFVRANSDPDDVFLTPRHQQTFKWYAHRAEVVNWKDIPQDVLSLREWGRRFVEVYPVELSTMRVTIRYDRLRHFRKRYGVDWMIIDRRVVGPHLPLVQVYPNEDERNSTYAIYRLPSVLP